MQRCTWRRLKQCDHDHWRHAASSPIGEQHSDDCASTRRLGLDERVNAEIDVVDKAWFTTDIANAWVFGTDRNDSAWQ